MALQAPPEATKNRCRRCRTSPLPLLLLPLLLLTPLLLPLPPPLLLLLLRRRCAAAASRCRHGHRHGRLPPSTRPLARRPVRPPTVTAGCSRPSAHSDTSLFVDKHEEVVAEA